MPCDAVGLSNNLVSLQAPLFHSLPSSPPTGRDISPPSISSSPSSLPAPSPLPCRNAFAALSDEVVFGPRRVSFADDTIDRSPVSWAARVVAFHERQRRMHRQLLVDRRVAERQLMSKEDTNVLLLQVVVADAMSGGFSGLPTGDGGARRRRRQRRTSGVRPPVSALRAEAAAFVPQGSMVDYVPDSHPNPNPPLSYGGDPFRAAPAPAWVEFRDNCSASVPPVEPFTSFGAIPVIRAKLEDIVNQGNLNLAELRRQQARVGVGGLPAPDPRPFSKSIRDMHDPRFMLSGEHPLPPGASNLKIEAFDAGHRAHCLLCQRGIHPECYFHSMRRQILCGISWPMDPEPPIPCYVATGPDGNHRSSGVYASYLASKCAKLLEAGFVAPFTGDPRGLIVSPHGVAAQRAKKLQMERVTNIVIRDDASYTAASAAFEEADPGFAPMKLRMITDLSASGVNDRCQLRRFRYAGLSSALDLVFPNCYFGVTDLDAYYYRFPVAPERYHHLGFRQDGVLYFYRVLPMGLAPAPYIASCWTAEFLAEQRARGVASAGMIDDFIWVAESPAACEEARAVVEGGFEAKGFVIAAGKRQGPSQIVNYTGFSINSVSMTVSVIPDKAAGFLLVLDSAIETLRAGGNVSHSDWQHICGKLEDYAQVSQLGKSYVAWAWSYLNYGPTLSEYGRTKLLSDLQWWHEQLSSWAGGTESGCEYPILNGKVLAANPDRINVIVTDMSGPDGTGAYYGPLHDLNPEFFSASWPDGGRPSNSFVGELLALKQTLVRQVDALRASGVGRPPPPSLLISVMDSLGAVQSVNSGRCADVVGRGILRDIYVLCAELRATVLGLWHYREENTLADMLTHLSSSLHRAEVRGRLSDLPGCLFSHGSERRSGNRGSDEGENCIHEDKGDCCASLSGLPEVLCSDGVPGSPIALVGHGSRLVSGGVHGTEFQPHSLAGRGPVQLAHRVPQARSRFPRRRRGDGGERLGERLEAMRRVSGQSEGSSAVSYLRGNAQEVGSVCGGSADACGYVSHRHPIGATHCGDNSGSAGDAFRLAPCHAAGVHLPGPYQDFSPWFRCVGDSGRYYPRDIGLQAPSSAMGGPSSGRPCHRVCVLPGHVHGVPPSVSPSGGVRLSPAYQARGGIHRS